MTVIRRSGAASARTALEKAEASLVAAREAWTEAEDTLARAIGHREELVDDEAAYKANDERIRELRTELGRRHRLIVRREEELEDAQAQLRRAEYDEARTELERACTTNGKRSSAAGETRETLARQLGELAQSRAKVQELAAKARALAPDDADDPLGGIELDEPAWGEVGDALQLAAEGPWRPDATTAETIAKADEERKRAQAGRAAQAVKDFLQYGDFDAIRKLAPEQLPTVLEFAERMREAEVERMTNALAGAPFAGASGRTNDVVAALDRRIERIRALAEQVEAAA